LWGQATAIRSAFEVVCKYLGSSCIASLRGFKTTDFNALPSPNYVCCPNAGSDYNADAGRCEQTASPPGRCGAGVSLGSDTCNHAQLVAVYPKLVSCLGGGGGNACFTSGGAYGGLAPCGASSGGGWTCNLSGLAACACGNGGTTCITRSCVAK
jgi:hypothetical protein